VTDGRTVGQNLS